MTRYIYRKFLQLKVMLAEYEIEKLVRMLRHNLNVNCEDLDLLLSEVKGCDEVDKVKKND